MRKLSCGSTGTTAASEPTLPAVYFPTCIDYMMPRSDSRNPQATRTGDRQSA